MTETPRTHAERSQAMRRRLVNTAIDVLRERSYQGTTVFEVAKAAGVTPGALQHHFGSKAVLMMRVVDEILRASDPGGVDWPAATLPLDERCRQLVQALWRSVYEPPRFLAAWNVYFGCTTDATLQAYISQQRGSLAQALHQRFAGIFPELAPADGFTAFVDLVLSALRGMGMSRLFDPDAPAVPAQLDALADLIAARCRAAAPRPARKRKTPR